MTQQDETRPLVSIVINNYNYGRFLGDAIESALGQTYPRVEVVVVDDGSTDDSREIIARYDRRIIPILKENGGQASAFNAGFARSSGDVVLFLDSDDMLSPTAVAEVMAAWRPGVAKVQFRLQMIDAFGEPQDRFFPSIKHAMPNGDVTGEILAFADYISPPASGNAFRRDVLAAILPMPEEEWRIGADTYLIYLAPFHGHVVSIDHRLGYYRVHGENNWEHSRADLTRLARGIDIALKKETILLQAARERDLPAPADLSLRTPQHVYERITRVLLDPQGAAEPLSLWQLVRKGLLATWRFPRTALSMKLLTTVWLLVTPFLPSPVAARLAIWRTYPACRPRFLHWLAGEATRRT